MITYIEAIEIGEGENLERHQEEVVTTEENALITINTGLNGDKTYNKRVHYCMHEHKEPCVTEEIINDTITTDKKPNIEVSN